MIACVTAGWTLFVLALGVAIGACGVVLTIRADIEREARADDIAAGIARWDAHLAALGDTTRGGRRRG